jgi:hypothetical protein
MKPMFEELEKQYPPKYNDKRPIVERVHSSKPEPGLGMKLKKDNPAAYAALQRFAVEAGLRGELPAERNRRLAEVKAPAAPKLLDEDEQIARSSFSEADIDRILSHQSAGSPDNLVAMKKSEPMKNYFTRLAAFSYGKLLTRPTKPTPEAKPASEQGETFELASDLCGKFNVPAGTHVSLSQFADLSLKYHDKVKAEAERVAAAAKVVE